MHRQNAMQTQCAAVVVVTLVYSEEQDGRE
jgi:hypothetical protein